MTWTTHPTAAEYRSRILAELDDKTGHRWLSLTDDENTVIQEGHRFLLYVEDVADTIIERRNSAFQDAAA